MNIVIPYGPKGRELAVVDQLDSDAMDAMRESESQSSGKTIPSQRDGFVRVMDDLGVLSIELPMEWHEIDGNPWVNQKGVRIIAAPSLAEYNQKSGPGVYLAASRK